MKRKQYIKPITIVPQRMHVSRFFQHDAYLKNLLKILKKLYFFTNAQYNFLYVMGNKFISFQASRFFLPSQHHIFDKDLWFIYFLLFKLLSRDKFIIYYRRRKYFFFRTFKNFVKKKVISFEEIQFKLKKYWRRKPQLKEAYSFISGLSFQRFKIIFIGWVTFVQTRLRLLYWFACRNKESIWVMYKESFLFPYFEQSFLCWNLSLLYEHLILCLYRYCVRRLINHLRCFNKIFIEKFILFLVQKEIVLSSVIDLRTCLPYFCKLELCKKGFVFKKMK